MILAAMENFKRGPDFAAWLGIVPRQHSSGGKARLGRVSKAGQADIRRLLIIGAMTRLNWLGQKTIIGIRNRVLRHERHAGLRNLKPDEREV